MTIKHLACVSSALLLLAGCGTSREYRADDFGESVHAMMLQQMQNPQAADNPPAGIRGPLLGDKAASSMDSYRKGLGPAGAPQSSASTPTQTFNLFSSGSGSGQ